MSLPTKAELLHGDLVDFTGNHKSVATNTLKIAEPLGKRHHDITRKVDSLVTKGLIDKRKLSLIYFVDSANRKQKAYELNEESALQVVMGLSGKKAEYRQAKHDVELFASLAMIKVTGKEKAPTSDQTERSLDNAIQ